MEQAASVQGQEPAARVLILAPAKQASESEQADNFGKWVPTREAAQVEAVVILVLSLTM